MWGVSVLDERGRIGVDCTGQLGVFYRSCLRRLMDLGTKVRNAILYILTAKPPLRVFVAKAVTQYVESLTQVPRLVGRVFCRLPQWDFGPRVV